MKPITLKMAVIIAIPFGILSIWLGNRIYYNYLDKTLTSSTAYEHFFDPYEICINTRGSGNIDALNIMAIKAYNEGNYKNAGIYFDSLIINSPSAGYLLYAGISKMETENFTGAISLFNRIGTDYPGSPFTEQAEWYKALAMLQTGYNKKESRNLIKTIAESDSYYNKFACEIFKSITK